MDGSSGTRVSIAVRTSASLLLLEDRINWSNLLRLVSNNDSDDDMLIVVVGVVLGLIVLPSTVSTVSAANAGPPTPPEPKIKPAAAAVRQDLRDIVFVLILLLSPFSTVTTTALLFLFLFGDRHRTPLPINVANIIIKKVSLR